VEKMLSPSYKSHISSIFVSWTFRCPRWMGEFYTKHTMLVFSLVILCFKPIFLYLGHQV